MKNKFLLLLKKALAFILVAGISFLILVMTIGNSENINQDGLLSFFFVLTPFVVPIFLGFWAAKKICMSERPRNKADTPNNVHQNDISPIPTPEPEKTTQPRKHAKKPIYKRWWFWMLTFIFLISSCGDPATNQDETADVTIPIPVASVPPTVPTDPIETVIVTGPTESVIVTEPVETTIVTETTEITIATEPATTPPITIEDAVQVIDKVLAENLTNYNISHKDKFISIEVWEYGIAAGIDAIAHGNTEYRDLWDELVDRYESTATSYCNLTRDMGLTDISVSINLLNDANMENTLLSVVNGVVVYNCLDDLEIQETTEPTIPETEETLSPREQLDAILETYDAEEFNQDTTYVLNTNTKKFHYKWCSSAGDIKPSNRMEVTTSRSDVISRGYKACKRCDP